MAQQYGSPQHASCNFFFSPHDAVLSISTFPYTDQRELAANVSLNLNANILVCMKGTKRNTVGKHKALS